MIIRRAKLEDIGELVELSVESVSRDPLPVKIDREAMRDTLRALYNPAHFLWVTEKDGRIVAGFAAQVLPSFWFTGKQCSVLLYYARERGALMPLMREFVRWLRPRSGIKLAVAELEPTTDPRLIKWLNRVGFTRQSANVCFVREPS